MANRLAGETSPYLLQHKDNPVDWRPWGPEALKEAKEGDNPIGFFGTGLKYALAILLRTGHKVAILSGTSKHRFALKDVKIRGQDFQVVTMDRHELGFTTQVGKIAHTSQTARLG